MKKGLTVLLLLFLAVAEAGAAEKAADRPSKVDPAKAQAIASQVCVACHGADGNSPAAANPKLAGQIPEYLHKQLRNFKAAEGKQPERVNAVMNGMVAALSEDDMRNLAAFYSGQQLKPEAARNSQTVDFGQKLYRAGDASKGLPACAGCHGPSGTGMPSQYPRIAGQFAEYTETQLKAFRSGERGNDPSKMMQMITIKMTDAEIKAVSDYVAGLR
jgi:cytochrome c553